MNIGIEKTGLRYASQHTSIPDVQDFKFEELFETPSETLITDASLGYNFQDIFEDLLAPSPETSMTDASLGYDFHHVIPSHETILSQWVLIGSGGFANIYTPPNTGLPSYVVKKPKQSSNESKELSEREYEILCVLQTKPHSHIIRFIQGVYEADDRRFFTHTYFCFEYAVLGDLSTYLQKEYINKNQYLSSYLLNELLLGIAMGMAHLHEQCKVLHRDIKPENIFLSLRQGKIISLIGDFGLSIQLSLTSDIAHTHAVGSMHYVAPESLFQNEYSVKSDIFSYAVLMYVIASLSIPFCSIFDTNRQRAFDLINSGIREKIPEDLIENRHKQMIHDCWAPNPKDRPDAIQIAQFLQEVQQDRSLSQIITKKTTHPKRGYEKWGGKYGIFDCFERHEITPVEARNPQDDVETHNALGF